MADQDIDFFDYVVEERRPPLLNKHLYMAKEHENYGKQLNFDKRLAKYKGFNSEVEVFMSRKNLDKE